MGAFTTALVESARLIPGARTGVVPAETDGYSWHGVILSLLLVGKWFGEPGQDAESIDHYEGWYKPLAARRCPPPVLAKSVARQPNGLHRVSGFSGHLDIAIRSSAMPHPLVKRGIR